MSDQEFAVICYNILMSGGPKGSTMDKSVDYMFEKLALLGHGYDAFAALDLPNQRRVIFYLGMWGFDIPPQIREHMNAEENAAKQLREKLGLDVFDDI
jgi:hypothetical protein